MKSINDNALLAIIVVSLCGGYLYGWAARGAVDKRQMQDCIRIGDVKE